MVSNSMLLEAVRKFQAVLTIGLSLRLLQWFGSNCSSGNA